MFRYFLTVVALICVFTWVAMLPAKGNKAEQADLNNVQVDQNAACCDIGAPMPPPRTQVAQNVACCDIGAPMPPPRSN